MYREEPTTMTLTIHSVEVAYDDASAEELKETKVVEAAAYEKNGKTYLKYEETEEGHTTATVLVVSPEELVIRRTGAVNSRMQFRPNLTYSFLYHTPYGDVPLSIATQDFQIEQSVEAIKIHLSYDILSQEKVVSFHQIQLEARAN